MWGASKLTDPRLKNEAFVLFDTYGTRGNEIANRINRFDNVSEVLPTEGAFDLIARIRADNEEILDIAIDKIDDVATIKTILKLKGSDFEKLEEATPDNSYLDQKPPLSSYVECDSCGIPLVHCHCRCPYCGQRDECECALFDAATGG